MRGKTLLVTKMLVCQQFGKTIFIVLNNIRHLCKVSFELKIKRQRYMNLCVNQKRMELMCKPETYV